ncbi:MAG: LysR family transcriptional regulator, partial [Dechloromonas agitata]|nr:LysR family transcriptional regulator [Dechloromonas agitata]
ARHFVMPEAISEFSRGGADIHIEVVESPYTDLLHRLRHGEIDFLIGALRYPQPVDDIVQEPLFSAALCVAAGKRHPLAARRNITLPDLAGFPWVLPLPGTPTRDRFARLMQEQAGVWQQGLVESSSQILIRGLLMNSDRLTLISRHQVQFEVDLGELVVLDYQISDSLRQIGLSFRGDWHPTVVQQEFLSVLRAVAARYSES